MTTTMSVSYVFALFDDLKIPPAQVATILATIVQAGCSNKLQVAQKHVLVRVCALVQAAIGCCNLLVLMAKMVLTLGNLRWW